MVTLFKKFKIGMFALGAMSLMMVAGWQFGVSGTDEVFTNKEVALENAIAGSGSDLKYVYGTIVVCGGGGCDTFDVCRYGPGFC
jgi:hypothetical protein